MDTWRHGGGLYLEHVAAAQLSSAHGKKRQALLLIKRTPVLDDGVCDTEETTQQHTTIITRSRRRRGRLQALLWKAEHGVEGQESRGAAA